MSMFTFLRLGKSPQSGWDVWSLGLPAVSSLPSEAAFASKHFVCLVSLNAERVEVAELAAFAERLLALGCVYFCCRGAGCERVHDVIDEVTVGNGAANVAWLDVMTTWHDKDCLNEAVDFFLHGACPAERYLNGCRTALAVTVGDSFDVASVELAIAAKLREPHTSHRA